VRYELEQRILNGDLKVKELPEAWDAAIEARLGVKPATAAEGCLQDIHWASGAFGYFPSYALGAVIAAQLYEGIRNDYPTLDEDIAVGKFGDLFTWLRERVHGYGALVSTPELIKTATGKTLSSAAWLRYVEGKYLTS